MKKLPIVLIAVVAIAVAFGPEVVLSFLGPGAPPAPELGPEAPADAIAFVQVPVQVSYTSDGFWFVSVDGEVGATVLAKPISQYDRTIAPVATGGFSGGHGAGVQFSITGSVFVGDLHWAIPEQVYQGHADSIGEVRISSAVAFFSAKGNYPITGNVLGEPIQTSNGMVLADRSSNSAVSGTVQVQ